jgi:hypothetical protein
MKNKKIILGAVAGLALALSSANAATTADVLFVVDESGSMSGEHAWIAGMVSTLDTALTGAGVTGNQYGLVGFGTSSHGPAGQDPHKHAVGGTDFGTAAQLSTAAGTLVASGGTEDGWEAIAYALNNYTFRANAALNVVLITDEDRDNTSGDTYASVLALLQSKNALLNAVINLTSFSPLGQNATDAYNADGSGGFTTGTPDASFGGDGTTVADYYDMALASGGAGWDLNKLRAGGNTATSFTAAFVDLKVGEIQQQEPSGAPDGGATMLLLGGGLCALTVLRRRVA